MSYTKQLERIKETVSQHPNLLEDIEGEGHVQENVVYHRDHDGIDVVIEPDSSLDTGEIESLLEERYAQPHSKRYRLEQDGNTYRIENIYGETFDVNVEDSQLHLRFDAGDDDWAFQETRYIAHALED